MKRTEMRERRNENGEREFCRLEVELRDRDGGLELSICGTAGVVMSPRAAKRLARDHWESFFEEAGEIIAMNQRCGTRFLSARSAARYVLEQDGDYHGIDVVAEENGRVYVAHSFGQIREELADFFPEVVPFFRWHLNQLRAGCEHQDARGERADVNLGAECLECGWKLGHGWSRRELPPGVIEWAKTGKGAAPPEPPPAAGPQWRVSGRRVPRGSLGGRAAAEMFVLNGYAPHDGAALSQAHRILVDRYEYELLACEMKGHQE